MEKEREREREREYWCITMEYEMSAYMAMCVVSS